MESKVIILIKGAGEIATGIAYRLFEAGYRVCLTEIERPLAVSRATCYSEAVFDGTMTIQNVTAELVEVSTFEIEKSWAKGRIPLIIDPETVIRDKLNPDVIIDARMLKKTTETRIDDAPLVIGVGPGFTAGKDVHIVVETNDRQGNLGKLIFQGEAETDTGIPLVIGGLTNERVVWAPRDGVFRSTLKIGDPVQAGEVIAAVADSEIKAPISGYLRGLIRDGVYVTNGTKLIEVDHVNDVKTFFMIREKMLIVGGAVVEAVKKNLSSQK